MAIDTLFDPTFRLEGAWIPRDNSTEFFPIASGCADAHQSEMQGLLKDTAEEVVINANPTGSGKTLSWVAPTIRSQENAEPWMVLATYPTIALVQDQREKIRDHFARYFDSPDWSSDSSFSLVEHEEVRYLSDGEREYSLDDLVVEITSDVTAGRSSTQYIKDTENEAQKARRDGLPVVFLTTPDTLTLMASNRFRDRDVASLLSTFDHIVVDEFHLSNPRGKRLLPFHLDVLRRFEGSLVDTLVFLSATPAPDYLHRIETALDATAVRREIGPKETEARQVLPETTLHVTTREMFSAGEWLANHVESILDFYSKTGQTLIVVDSVQEVEDIYTSLVEKTSHDIGRVYGWKREGRQKTINEADIVVGNTAVEVGIDFEDVNRVIFTGYDAASTLQRLGRMRYRADTDEYQAALITTPEVQSALQKAADEQAISRERFEDVINQELSDPVERPYYDLLCAAYARYLWLDASGSGNTDRSLRVSFLDDDQRYRQIIHDHFAASATRLDDAVEMPEVDEFWNTLETIQERYYDDGRYPIFEEMHTYRSTSLTCVVLDLTDLDEEPLKQYSLRHVLRYREVEIVPIDGLKRRYTDAIGGLPEEVESKIDDWWRYSCACAVTWGRRENPRFYRIGDFGYEDVMKSEWGRDIQSCKPRPLWDPRINVDPIVEGVNEHIDLLGEDDESYARDILAQYAGRSADEVRTSYNLGPYANIAPIDGESCLVLWQDGIIAHSHIQPK